MLICFFGLVFDLHSLYYSLYRERRGKLIWKQSREIQNNRRNTTEEEEEEKKKGQQQGRNFNGENREIANVDFLSS
jgi:hypothetical protein